MKAKNTNRFLYNPSRMPEADLLERFIVRERQFQLLWADISASKLDKIDQHFLIIGQRGMGKTTLMLKTAYEIRRAPQLKEWLLPVVFPEELFGVTDLTGLWLALSELLEDHFPGLLRAVQELLPQKNEAVLLEAIRGRLLASKQKLVIFLDNFGDLLDRLDTYEVLRLREILMQARDLRIVAASARLIDHTYRYDKPFFDFFHPIHLSGLSRGESETLMSGLADQAGKREVFEAMLQSHPGRIEAIRRLTGGVPRLLLLLYSSLMEEGETELMDDLEIILDQVSPYYKHRVEDLQSQQRSIFHHVAMAWDAVSTAEIATATRLESKKVSAQLQQMADSGILERVETGGKNHLYRLQERFFNIWYLMRMAGHRGAERMKWLVAFFETWLEGAALRQKLKDLATDFRSDGYFEYASGLESLLELVEKEPSEEPALNPAFTSPDLLPYNLQLKDAGSWSDSLNIYDSLQKQGLTPDVVTFTTLIRRSPKWEEAIWALAEMQRFNVRPDVVTFTLLIGKASNWDEANWALEEMQRFDVRPNFVTFNTLIRQAPKWKEAIWALEETQRFDVRPDVVTFSTLTRHSPNWEEAIWAFVQMQRFDVKPDVVAFSTLIDKAPNWKEAMWAFEEMQRFDVRPDVVTFTTLIRRSPKWEEAIWAFEEMQQHDVRPDVVTFNTLIGKTPNWEEAIWALEEMQRYDVSPDVVTFSTIIDQAPNWKEAMWALEEMQRFDVRPDVVTFTTLIDQAPTWEEAMWALEEMQRYGVRPDVVTFNTAWKKSASHTDFIWVLEAFKGSWDLDSRPPRTYDDGKQDLRFAIVHLWENRFAHAHQLAERYFEKNGPNGQHLLYQEFYLLELLIRYQVHECHQLFERSPHRLKDVFKPIWYALLKLMGEKGQKEYLRMGPELEETVSEIVAFVQKMRDQYPY